MTTHSPTDRLYPEASRNPDFPAIRIRGADHFKDDVVHILDHIRRTRIGAFIVDSILLNADRREGLIIRPRGPHAPNNQNAFTTPRGAIHRSDQPNGTKVDFLAHPGRGAGSNIDYNPYEWPAIGVGPPGDARDEVLLHELVHAYMIQRGLSSTRRLNHAGFVRRVRRFDTVDDFYAIMVTNVYASERGRPRLRDHRFPSLNLARNGISVASDPQFLRFFNTLRAHAHALNYELQQIDTAFNPWRPRRERIDVTAAFDNL